MTGVTVEVAARPHWVGTGVRVAAGQTVDFSATGQWRDWVIDCGPAGYDRLYLTPLAWLRRVPSAPWFCLCVALDQDMSTATAVGASARHTFDRPGQIFAFANDVPFAYGNNSGAVTLRIVLAGGESR